MSSTLSSPQFFLTSLSLPLPLSLSLSLNPLSLLPMLIRKTLNLLDHQLVCSMLRPPHQGTVLGSFGDTGRGEMQDDGGPSGRDSCSGSLRTSQVLVLYCFQPLPGRILTWSQRMWPYPPPPHLNTNQQHRLKIKAQCFLSLNHEKKILLIK